MLKDLRKFWVICLLLGLALSVVASSETIVAEEGNGPVKFRGTVITHERYGEMVCYGSYYVQVTIEGTLGDSLIQGIKSVEVCYKEPLDLQPGEKVKVYGYYWGGPCPLQNCGRVVASGNSYYIVRLQTGWYDWPMFHYNAQRTGRAAGAGMITDPGALQWTFNTGYPIASSPVVGKDGTIYIGSTGPTGGPCPTNCPKLYAINPHGTPKWEFATTLWGKITSASAIAPESTNYPGRIYAFTHESSGIYANVFAITDGGPNSPILEWSLTLPSNDWVGASSPVIVNDGGIPVIYVGSGNGYLYRIEDHGTSGSIAPVLIRPGHIASSPAISAGTIYIGQGDASGDGNLYAINPNGTIKWVLQVGTTTAEPVFSPSLIEGPEIDGRPQTIIYVGTGDSRLVKVADVPGSPPTLVWSFGPVEGWVVTCPAIYDLNGDGNIEVVFGTANYFNPLNNYVYAVTDLGNAPQQYWRFGPVGMVLSSPAIALAPQPTVFIGSNDGRVYSINWDGTVMGHYQTGGAVVSSPAVAQPETELLGAPGWVFVGSEDNNLYAFGPD